MADTYPNQSTNLLNTIVPAPTLSTLGFIHDSTNKFDTLLAHAFVADYNQTYLYPGKITSLSRMFESGNGNVDSIAAAIKDGLYAYLNKYYESVVVDCTVKTNDRSSGGDTVHFELVITVTEEGNQNVYGRLITAVDSKLSKIIKLINYGE